MDNYLFDLLPQNNKLPLFSEETERIQNNLEVLKGTLNKNQKKLLLRVIDDMDLITEKTAQDFFTDGFRTGVKIMIETLSIE